MDTIFFLLGAFGIWTWVFLAVCVVLGVRYARARWFVDSDQLANLQAERRQLEAELLQLRQEIDWSRPEPAAESTQPAAQPKPLAPRATVPKPAPEELKRLRGEQSGKPQTQTPQKIVFTPPPDPEPEKPKVEAAPASEPKSQPEPEPVVVAAQVPEPAPAAAEADATPALITGGLIIEREDEDAKEKIDTTGLGLDAGEITDLAMGGASAIVVEQTAPDTVDHARVLAEHFQDEPVRVDPQLGIIYDVEPNVLDPLRLIKGVGPRVERSLNELGVFRFKQIANWSKQEDQNFTKRLENHETRIGRDRWISQAKELWPLFETENASPFLAPEEVDHESKILSEFTGEDVKADPILGIVFREPPELVDELHRINGIGPLIVEGLHQLGIFRYKQIAAWSRLNVIKIGEKVERTAERISNERWIPQAKRYHWEVYSANPEWGSANPTLSDYSRKIERNYAKENVRADGDLGVIYKAPPEHIDDLTQVFGISAEYADKLNMLGIWKFRQIADWSEANVRAFATKLGIERQRIYLEEWIPQAWKLGQMARKKAAFAGEYFRTDPKLGIVYYQTPASPDELTQIAGLTPEIADWLRSQEIHTFKQIALWEPENVRHVAELCGISKNEIFRNRWVSQADELHYKKYGTEL